MIVGVCGFGYTGSGAVWDYLKEFEEVSVSKDVELSFLYDPDGILELEYRIATCPIRFFSGDAAIKRFRKYILSYDLCKYMRRAMPEKQFRQYSKEYISNLIQLEWRGFWHFDKRNISKLRYFIEYYLIWKVLRLYNKLGCNIPNLFMKQRMYVPVSADEFYKATEEYLDKILNCICDSSKEILVLDQPFPANSPERCFKFWGRECKAIVVMKDPRDLYCFVKKYGGAYSVFVPSEDVHSFITYYRYQMELFRDETENVKVVWFEDLIYKYEKTTKEINEFIGLKNHVLKNVFFNPAVSVANTQIYRKCKEYQVDIDCIEKELGEYLYPFENDFMDNSISPFL